MLILTERLLLREFELSDVAVLHRYQLHPHFRRFEESRPLTEYQFYRIVQDIIAEQASDPRQSYYFAIEQRQDGQVAGSVYIAVRQPEARQAEIGYMLGVDFWGQGYATEAARAVLGFGFETLAMHRIYAEALRDNQASIRVLEKLGMRREALLHENQWFQGRWWDTCIYALLEQEWRKD
jgi:RimJ/RimL family protein N-acetyltransferase